MVTQGDNTIILTAVSLVNIEQLVTRPRNQVGGQDVLDEKLLSPYKL